MATQEIASLQAEPAQAAAVVKVDGEFAFLADVNASLNALALLLIILGLIAIKRGRIETHKKFMLSAASVSAVFLASYLVYHYLEGSHELPARHQGAIRYTYLTILISHIILAVVQVPLIIMTIVRGLQDKRDKHKFWARITAPIWLYVSVTGVVVYLVLYHM